MAEDRNIVRETARRAADRRRNDRFRATVDSVTGNQISVKRLGQATAEGPYPAASGLAASVVAGDTVIVLVIGGVPSVAYKEVT